MISIFLSFLILINFLISEIQHVFFAKENDWGYSPFLTYKVLKIKNLKNLEAY